MRKLVSYLIMMLMISTTLNMSTGQMNTIMTQGTQVPQVQLIVPVSPIAPLN